MMMGSYFMNKTPFLDVYIHPLIRDEKGQKMSKSKGNIIDPLDLLDKFGTDTVRFTLTALINPGRDVKLSEARVKGYKSFVNKIWNAANYLIINKCVYNEKLDIKSIKLPLNQWIINELLLIKNNIEKYISKYLFHEIANDLYHFIWHQYCDWYIELSKSIFKNESENIEEVKNVAIWTFIEILKISHPIMPFITEKLWNELTNKKEFLINEKISIYEPIKSFNNSQSNIKHLIEIISSIRNIRAEFNISYKTFINIEISNNNDNLISFLKIYKNELINLLKLNEITYTKNPSNIIKSSYIIIDNSTIIIPLEGIIDTDKELIKMNNKKNEYVAELENIDSKLNNPSFLNKAPSDIIDQFKKQAIESKSSIEKIQQIIDTIRK